MEIKPLTDIKVEEPKKLKKTVPLFASMHIEEKEAKDKTLEYELEFLQRILVTDDLEAIHAAVADRIDTLKMVKIMGWKTVMKAAEIKRSGLSKEKLEEMAELKELAELAEKVAPKQHKKGSSGKQPQKKKKGKGEKAPKGGSKPSKSE